jgi:hypothetical protein
LPASFPAAADKNIPVVAMLVAREKTKKAEREQIIAEAPEWLVRTKFRQRLPRARRRADHRRGKAELQSRGHRADEDQFPGFLRVNGFRANPRIVVSGPPEIFLGEADGFVTDK